MPINRKLQNIIGTEHITDAAETAIAAQASGGATVAFKNVAVSGQDNVVADAATDTLTLVGGSNVTITTDASADSVTIAADGGGAIASIQDLKPQLDSSMLASGGDYQKTLGGAPFFLNLASWSTIQFASTDFRDGSNTFVVMWPYLGSGETMVKSRAYRVSVGGQDNDTEMNFVWYASDSDGIPTGAPVNSGICTLTNSQSAGAAILEATWTNGPTLTAGELYWFGIFIDTTSSDGAHTTDMGNIRATPSFENEALGFSSSDLAINSGNFGRVTGLKCSTSCGTTNGSRSAPTIGAGTISLAAGAGYNVPRVTFEVTYS